MPLKRNSGTAPVRTLLSLLSKEATNALVEPKKLAALDIMTRITVRVMTRIIIGTELSRDEKYLKAVESYMNGNFLCGLVMLNFPFAGPIRDAIAWPLWKWHQVFNQGRLINMIRPVVKRRMEEFEQGTTEKPVFDAMTCALQLLKEYPFDPSSKEPREQTLAHETLLLIWASGQSPAMSVTTVIFKLLEEPQYLEQLREEARAAIDKHGWMDPIFNELPMMDSFIRETHRLHPAFSRTSHRSVLCSTC
jgi:cytochrome P450